MNHRQRVLAALNHQEPDRVPVDLGSTRNTSMLVETYQALVEYLKPGSQQEKLDDFGQSKIARVVNLSEDVLRRLDENGGRRIQAPDGRKRSPDDAVRLSIA